MALLYSGLGDRDLMLREESPISSDDCFLCRPDRRLLFAEGASFYVMLGLGPIVEGYSIMATKQHIPSYLDLPPDLLDEYQDFRERALGLIARAYVRPVITEHGRVPACDFYDREPNQAHCYHAHQLLFPATIDLQAHLHQEYGNYVLNFVDFHAAYEGMASRKDEYLYFEGQDGACLVIPAPHKHIRQYFRLLAAEAVGHPERTSWQGVPGWEMIEAALTRLNESR